MSEELKLLKELYEHIERSKKDLEQKSIKFCLDCNNLIDQIKDRIYVIEHVIRKKAD